MITPLTPGQASNAFTILRDSAMWTAAELAALVIVDHARRGELVGGLFDGRVVACMLLQDADPVVWPDARAGEALYLHKLAVARERAGRGLGERMLAFAADAARRRGALFLRLDTMAGTWLEAYYRRLGFDADPAGPADYSGRLLIRMQKPVAHHRSAQTGRGAGAWC